MRAPPMVTWRSSLHDQPLPPSSPLPLPPPLPASSIFYDILTHLFLRLNRRTPVLIIRDGTIAYSALVRPPAHQGAHPSHMGSILTACSPSVRGTASRVSASPTYAHAEKEGPRVATSRAPARRWYSAARPRWSPLSARCSTARRSHRPRMLCGILSM
jgi:hypothetical protein